jgi:hypothetical protein
MLTPSTAHLWTNCALSGALNAGKTGDMPHVPKPDERASEAKREGTAADWIANGVLRGDAASCAEFDGETAPNGHVITPDMTRHVQGYVDYCRSRGDVVRVQVPISLPHLHIRGLADAQIVQATPALEIIDLKYGFKIVDAMWNPQLLCSAIALFDHTKHDTVTMTVYQPRPFHPEGKVRSWTLDSREMVDAYHWLSNKALAALSPAATGTPGAEWCGMCDARTRCEALNRATYSIFDTVRGSKVEKLNAEALGVEAKFLKDAVALIKARHDGVFAEVEGRMRRGEYIPGWMWSEGLRDREWTAAPHEIEAKTGLSPFKQVLKSPAELEKEGVHPDTIAELTDRPRAAPRLVPATKKAFAQLFAKFK